MNLKSLFKPIAAAIAGLALTATAASAVEATTTLNVRSGPSSHYQVIDTLYAGENVNVETCRSNGWCFITHRGSDGWVSSRYLTANGYAGPRYQKRYVAPVRPYVRTYPRQTNSFSLQFGTGGFGFSLNDGYQNRPHRDCYRRHGHTVCR